MVQYLSCKTIRIFLESHTAEADVTYDTDEAFRTQHSVRMRHVPVWMSE